MDFLMDFLRFALPGGFLGGIVTWIAGRRKRNNDMLSQLQSSINMLSSENRKILDENINLRVENAELKANQEAMLLKLTNLTKEIERLRKLINGKERNAKERKSNITAGRRAADRMRSTEDRNVGKDRTGEASGREQDVCAGQYGTGTRGDCGSGRVFCRQVHILNVTGFEKCCCADCVIRPAAHFASKNRFRRRMGYGGKKSVPCAGRPARGRGRSHKGGIS